jgi:hypothetical protein
MSRTKEGLLTNIRSLLSISNSWNYDTRSEVYRLIDELAKLIEDPTPSPRRIENRVSALEDATNRLEMWFKDMDQRMDARYNEHWDALNGVQDQISQMQGHQPTPDQPAADDAPNLCAVCNGTDEGGGMIAVCPQCWDDTLGQDQPATTRIDPDAMFRAVRKHIGGDEYA